MRMANGLVLALSVVVLLSAPALAQGRGGFGRGMGGGGGLMLLGNKGVQQELKLESAQAEKVNSYVQEAMAKRREQFQKLQDLSEDERRTKMQEMMRTANEENQKALKDLLTPAQLSRFNQIELQQRSVMAFNDPEVRSKLKLNEDQTKQVQGLVESYQTESREVFQNAQGGNFAETQKSLAVLRKDKMDKVSALLTEDQKKAWKDMTGEPYEVKFEPRPRPGGN